MNANLVPSKAAGGISTACEAPTNAIVGSTRGESSVERAVRVVAWVLVSVGALELAYASKHLGYLGVIYLFGLVQLARAKTWRNAFYPGLCVGLLLGALRLQFLWRIFSAGAIALWFVYAFWIGLFVALARLCISSASDSQPAPEANAKGPAWAWCLLPFLWCGIEYFRSELYYLKFSWLSPGLAFGSQASAFPLPYVGCYGAGFLLMTVACLAARLWTSSRAKAIGILVAGVCVLRLSALILPARETSALRAVEVAGVQMEFPAENEVLTRLNALLAKVPNAKLLVLSEYTLADTVPEPIKAWCRRHRVYLVVGGKDPATHGNFYDTAFVIGPSGQIVFRQGKSVPIQFFKDGLPAPRQQVWNSPWGKIGICVCYDLSYSRVTDRLVRLGAQGLIVPTMDLADWGKAQHEMHALVAPVRAAEYGVPIFRVASSGISQLVSASGQEVARAPYPGDGVTLSGELGLSDSAHLPWDRSLAPLATAITAATILAFLIRGALVTLGSWRTGRLPQINNPGC